MCPRLTSTAMPSGIRHSWTMTLRSEPSGFTESTRLPLSSRTNKRPGATGSPAARADSEVLSFVIFSPFIVDRALTRHLSDTHQSRIDRPQRSFVLPLKPVSRKVRDGHHQQAV